jgi:hypothetical protein
VKQTNRLHWTQRPENRDRVLEMARRGGRTAKAHNAARVNGAEVATKSRHPLLSEHTDLMARIKARVTEIQNAIHELEAERLGLQLLLNEDADNRTPLRHVYDDPGQPAVDPANPV